MITGGQSFVAAPPSFSNDAKKLLICTGNTVSIFSTATGLQVAELEGHQSRVTSVVVVPASGVATKFVNFCWTSSLDGTICYWDFAVAQLVKRVKVDRPIFSMVIPNISNTAVESGDKASNICALVSVEEANKQADQSKAPHGQIQMYNLTTSCRIGGLLAETQTPEFLSMSKSGEFVGVRNKRKLHIWKIPRKNIKENTIKKIKLHHTKNLSALAFHPNERIVAGGDITGRILIWRDFGRSKFSNGSGSVCGGRTKNEEENPGVRDNDDADSCSTWHWHPSEVKFLFFSSDGAYLYSGGKEGVLVVWQLDTGKKKFKPRLGSPLLYFTDSSDPTLSCVSCVDNQIHLLKMPSMEITKSISGIKLPFSSPDKHEAPHCDYAFDHSAGLLALRTQDYCIQFFSLFDNLEVSQVQVCERNFQPFDDVTVYVALVALSVDGSLMGTVDVKLPEERLGGLVSLRFWARGSRIGEYSLSTVIYEPHSDAGISALAFRPGHNMAVSSSVGGDFKVWVRSSDIQQKDDKKRGWRCQSVGSYKKKPMTAATFSADGSVLAVAAEIVITLWDPDTNVLVAVIGDALTPIMKLSFISNSEYLVSLSRGNSMPQLAVWSLSKLSMYWSYSIFAEAVSSTEDGSHFAVLASPSESKGTNKDGIILLFNVEEFIPAAIWSVKKARGGGVAFLPASLSSNEIKTTSGKDPLLLAYLNGDREYIVFDPLSSDGSLIRRSFSERQGPAEVKERFGYASIYGELPEFDMKEGDQTDAPFVPSERLWETVFSGPSHALPPLTKLCQTLLESFLEKRPSVVQ